MSVSALEVNSLIDQVQDLLLDHRVGPPVSWNGVDSGPGGLEVRNAKTHRLRQLNTLTGETI